MVTGKWQNKMAAKPWGLQTRQIMRVKTAGATHSFSFVCALCLLFTKQNVQTKKLCVAPVVKTIFYMSLWRGQVENTISQKRDNSPKTCFFSQDTIIGWPAETVLVTEWILVFNRLKKEICYAKLDSRTVAHEQ